MAGLENIQPSTAVTPVSPTAPARDAKLWDAAKQFEQVLTEQLAKQLQATAQPSDDDSGDDDSGDSTSGGQDAVSNMYTQMLPGALAQSVSDGGGLGLGLAQKLYDSMAQKQGAAQ
jgi:Rod binding domain-containing protein